MPFIEAPVGTVRAVFDFTLQGQVCNVIQYHNIGPAAPTTLELQTFANDLHTAFGSVFDDVLTNELTLDKVTVTMVEAENGPQAQSTNAAHTFAVNIASVNNALAVQYSMGTGLSGRSFRGKMFVPGGRSDNIAADSNYWASTGGPPSYLEQLQTAGEDWLLAANTLTPVGATSNEWSVASYFSGTTGPPLHTPIARDTAVVTPISSITVRARIATQRRRRPRS